MPGQQHDPGAKRQAQQVYERHGSRRAAEITGISRRTINAWAKAERWQRHLATTQPSEQGVAGETPHASARVATLKRAPEPAGYRRGLLLQQLSQEAAGCLAQLAKEREAGRSGAARNWAWCVGILLERAELLAKAAGGNLAAGQLDPATASAQIDGLLDVIEGRAGGA